VYKYGSNAIKLQIICNSTSYCKGKKQKKKKKKKNEKDNCARAASRM